MPNYFFCGSFTAYEKTFKSFLNYSLLSPSRTFDCLLDSIPPLSRWIISFIVWLFSMFSLGIRTKLLSKQKITQYLSIVKT